MKYDLTTWIGAALVAFGTINPAVADSVRLPPSVGATPIEISRINPDAPMVQMPGTGHSSATPIEIPRINPDAPMVMVNPNVAPRSVLPVPLPGRGIEQLDPRRTPGAFSVLPVPLPDTAKVGNEGRFSLALLADGTVYGDTNFGYARFANLADYRRFLRSH